MERALGRYCRTEGVYDLKFKSFRPLDVTGPLTCGLLHGQIDVATDLDEPGPRAQTSWFVGGSEELFPAQNI